MENSILWREGMSLHPHHFQQAELHRDWIAQYKSRFFNAHAWGFSKLIRDSEALQEGKLRLRNVEGIFPGGAVFCAAKIDYMLPKDFMDSDTSELVYLCVPELRLQGGNLADPGSVEDGPRFASLSRTIPDLNSGALERKIEFAELKLRLRLGRDVGPEEETLLVGRLNRNSRGEWQWESNCWCPVLDVFVVEELLSQVENLVSLIKARYRYFLDACAGGPEGSPGARSLAALLGSGLWELEYLLRAKNIPPEPLFRCLLRIYGGLTAYIPGELSRDFWEYHHKDLYATFFPLMRGLREMISGTPKAGVRILPAKKISSQEFSFEISETPGSNYYLALASGHPEMELSGYAFNRLKMASPEKIGALVRSAMSGIPLGKMGESISRLPTKAGFEYFRLDNTCPLFEECLAEKKIHVHSPAADQISLELLVEEGI